MERNLSIFNFNKQEIHRFLEINRALMVTLILLGFTSFVSFRIAEIAQEGTKQSVRCKRLWAKQGWIFQQARGKDTVLFLGNSKITAGIIPDLFDRQMDGKVYSFNMSLPALPLAPDYFLLKDYLEHNPPPTYIIMTLNPDGFKQEVFPYYAPLNAGLAEVIEYSVVRKDGDVLVNYLLPLRLYWPEIKRYFISKALCIMPSKIRDKIRQKYVDRSKGEETFHHDWGYLYDLRYVNLEKTAQKREDLLKVNRGYYDIAEQGSIGGIVTELGVPKVESRSDNQIFLSMDPSIKDFFDLALAKKIDVFIIPDYTLSQNGQERIFPDSWKLVDKRYNNVYFSNSPYKRYGPQYFSDPTHVNLKGAVRYTNEIAHEFKDIFYTVQK